MTGFGRVETHNGDHAYTVEVRSVNNRFLEVNARLPKYLSQLEIPLKKLVKDNFSRGSFDLSVSVDKIEGASAELEVVPNIPLAAQYLQSLKQIRDSLGLDEQIELKSILNLRDLIKLEPPKLKKDNEMKILETVRSALNALAEMRQEEGRNLEADISNRLNEIAEHARFIKGRQNGVLKEYQEKLRERICQLTGGIQLDEARIAQETALLAERADISEELTRLESHLNQFLKLLQEQGPMGRKLEFLLQEINRETNTLGSKTSDIQVSRTVIEMKSTIEKVREQIQNIE